VATSALIDPYGGERDLSKNILRAVGDPAKRFAEDYTRILRLLRFSVELNFSVHPATWAAAKKLVPRLNEQRTGQWILPRELVAKELLKSCAANPREMFLLWDRIGAWRVLIPELVAMKGVPQPEQYHTEGDVWRHTELALSVLMSNVFAKQFPDGWDAETALAVLFHDIGKPPTLKTPQKHGIDRIRFDGHDAVGAALTRAIAERLALQSYKSERIAVSAERLAWVVAHHLLMVNADANDLRPQTIEHYFFSEKNPGDVLQKVMFCDTAATINANGKPFWKSYRALQKRIAAVAKARSAAGTMPKPLLTGTEIMKTLRLTPGPTVGTLIAALRDAQLSGKVRSKEEARAFLTKHH
jgi:poly(A) polymerase